MARINRVPNNDTLIGGADAKALEYNPAAGAEKALTVGPKLVPIPIASGWTTNASAGLVLPHLGICLAIYNNSGTAGSITASPAAAASLAIGVVDASGNVGVACPPNAWTYLSMGVNRYIITSASTIIVYIIEDPTMIQPPSPYAQQNPGPYAQNAVNT